jgi:hypothetical protein
VTLMATWMIYNRTKALTLCCIVHHKVQGCGRWQASSAGTLQHQRTQQRLNKVSVVGSPRTESSVLDQGLVGDEDRVVPSPRLVNDRRDRRSTTPSASSIHAPQSVAVDPGLVLEKNLCCDHMLLRQPPPPLVVQLIRRSHSSPTRRVSKPLCDELTSLPQVLARHASTVQRTPADSTSAQSQPVLHKPTQRRQ